MFTQNKVQHNPRKFGVKQIKARRRGLTIRFDWHRNANGRGRIYIAAGQMSVEAFNPSHVDHSAFSGRREQSSIAWQLVTKMRSEDPTLFDAIAATTSPLRQTSFHGVVHKLYERINRGFSSSRRTKNKTPPEHFSEWRRKITDDERAEAMTMIVAPRQLQR